MNKMDSEVYSGLLIDTIDALFTPTKLLGRYTRPSGRALTEVTFRQTPFYMCNLSYIECCLKLCRSHHVFNQVNFQVFFFNFGYLVLHSISHELADFSTKLYNFKLQCLYLRGKLTFLNVKKCPA